jgi:hypothetical protein
MAGDGFVRMPGEPARWVRLIEGGYQLAVEYREDDRHDLITCLESGRNFKSSHAFGEAVEDVFSILRGARIDDVVREDEFSKSGPEIIRTAKSSGPSCAVHVAGIVEARLTREFAREYAKSGNVSLTATSSSKECQERVSHWKQLLFTRNERGVLDFMPDEDYEPHPMDWYAEPFPKPEGIEYLVWCTCSSASEEARRASPSRPDGTFCPTPLAIP